MKLIAIALSLFLAASAGAQTNTRDRAAHVLNRLAFGARPADVERLTDTGIDRWIEQQLRPETIGDSALEARLAQYATLTMDPEEIVERYYEPIVEARKNAKKNAQNSETESEMRPLRKEAQKLIAELSAQRILRAADSERQLNEVMADFWLNHFNVFAGKSVDRFLLTSYERDVIRPNMWGRFDDLLIATAKSPAMLFYLDNARSRKGGINENYAREIMELHTLGVDAGYTQKDVTELARVLTGWSINRPKEGSGFVFRRMQHDRDAKVVLGTKIAAGGGMDEGERMIRILASHPATARHIAYKLAQRFVADEPPKALVDRVAKRFLDTKGDLRETVRAVVTSPEFNDPKYYAAKVKSPFEYAISAVRAVNGKINNPLPLARELQKMGQPLYFSQPPTGYAEEAEAWVNSGAILNRINFAIALAGNKMPGIVVGMKNASSLALGSPEFQRQ
ncbi:MAG: DUF1800 domain-containing protein [Thermoanaerobaculia bacterium]|nr:DUF1800 domain-containing protein [Thermoanaerobaculia bacterium]